MYNFQGYDFSECKTDCASNSSMNSDGMSKKRRRDSMDDDNESMPTSKSNDRNKRQNHSEIEKRRRDKMNTYILELSSLIPMGTSRKLDKLTVLRMAVQHMKMLRGSLHSYTEGHYKPSFLSDEELKKLILQAADGFLFVVGCDRGRILYVSESVSQTLQHTHGELLGTSWFDILHPKDLTKVKEQLSSSDISRRERLVDAKTLLPVKSDMPQGMTRLCPGSRRSFFCRMRCKHLKEDADTTTGCSKKKSKGNASEKKYSIIHFTGYLKSWAPSKDPLEEETDADSCNLSCLVAVGRVHHSLLATLPSNALNRGAHYPIEFVSKHTNEGKYVFVDPKASLLLQWLPQELLGTSMYEYFHPDDIPALAESHRYVLQQTESVETQLYRFRVKNGSFLQVKSVWKTFKNPWTKDIEYIISKNSVVWSEPSLVESSMIGEDASGYTTMDTFNAPEGCSLVSSSRLSEGVHAGKIGRQIVDEVLEGRDPKDTAAVIPQLHGILHEAENNTSDPLNDEESTSAVPKNCQRKPRKNLHSIQVQYKNEAMSSYSDSSCLTKKSSHNSNLLSGQCSANNKAESDGALIGADSQREDAEGDSDEAAMAVLMSLLEAEAGLGGPVDFSHLPWPLP